MVVTSLVPQIALHPQKNGLESATVNGDAKFTWPRSDDHLYFTRREVPEDLSEEIQDLRRQVDQAYEMLDMLGVPKERARSIQNGIMVLTSRYDKRIFDLEQALREKS